MHSPLNSFGYWTLNNYYYYSLCTGELPTEWTQANVAPILKKGSKFQAVNYRPVSSGL